MNAQWVDEYVDMLLAPEAAHAPVPDSANRAQGRARDVAPP